MKIIPESIIKNNIDIAKKQNQPKNMPASETAVKASAYDKMTIESDQGAEISDEQFIAQLKKSILAETQIGAPEYKLDDIKRQIALNDYDVNISDIVRKLMNDNEVGYE